MGTDNVFSLSPSSDQRDLGFHKAFLLASKARKFVLKDNTSSVMLKQQIWLEKTIEWH